MFYKSIMALYLKTKRKPSFIQIQVFELDTSKVYLEEMRKQAVQVEDRHLNYGAFWEHSSSYEFLKK